MEMRRSPCAYCLGWGSRNCSSSTQWILAVTNKGFLQIFWISGNFALLCTKSIPGLQGLQNAADDDDDPTAVDAVPAGQSLHAVLAMLSSSLYLPAGHCSQVDLDNAYMPRPHVLHAVAASNRSENLPASHEAQIVRPSVLVYFPVVQYLQPALGSHRDPAMPGTLE
jgi:hypothetical protein